MNECLSTISDTANTQILVGVIIGFILPFFLFWLAEYILINFSNRTGDFFSTLSDIYIVASFLPGYVLAYFSWGTPMGFVSISCAICFTLVKFHQIRTSR